MTKVPEKSAGKQAAKNPHRTRFQPGRSGNPKGKPIGCRNLVTRAVDALLDGEAEELTRKAIEKALDGDTVALRLCLDRICPPRKERHIQFRLPEQAGTVDHGAAVGQLIKEVAAGSITPEEAQRVASLIETSMRIRELAEFDQRLKALEAKNAS